MNMRARVYYPQPVYLPRDSSVERQQPTEWYTQWESRQPPPPSAEARLKHDSRTLFYDMFFSAGELVCLGPPFVNLGSPTAVYCDGERVRSLREYDGKPLHFQNYPRDARKFPAELHLKIPVPEGRERLDLHFCFRDFEISVPCDVQRACSLSLPPKNLAMAAVNRNNAIEWIRDWCAWHHRAHGVQRIVLYDNGSRYFPALGAELADLDEHLEIILVHWPFPFGPRNSSVNRFCQTGALNHFRLSLGASVRWGISLDIDEYLYSDADQSLEKWLAQPQRALRPAVYLASFIVPRTKLQKTAPLPRFFDYSKREARGPHWKARKHIFQPGQVLVCRQHDIFMRKQDFRFLKSRVKPLLGFLLSRMPAKKKKEKHALGNAPGKGRAVSKPMSLLYRILAPRFHKGFQRQYTFFFFHYKELNTRWKFKPGAEVNVPEPEPKALVEDQRVRDLAGRLGFVKGRGDPPA